jgi:DNA-binding NtrC family response regulator
MEGATMDAGIDARTEGQDALRRRVLVVDDEPLIRWAMVAALTSARYEVIEAGDGATANRKALRHQPLDVALLDFRLPDVDGVTLLKELQHVHPNCRFILMTACRTPVLATVPDVPVIDKPFHIDEVIDKVNQSVSPAV